MRQKSLRGGVLLVGAGEETPGDRRSRGTSCELCTEQVTDLVEDAVAVVGELRHRLGGELVGGRQRGQGFAAGGAVWSAATAGLRSSRMAQSHSYYTPGDEVGARQGTRNWASTGDD